MTPANPSFIAALASRIDGCNQVYTSSRKGKSRFPSTTASVASSGLIPPSDLIRLTYRPRVVKDILQRLISDHLREITEQGKTIVEAKVIVRNFT